MILYVDGGAKKYKDSKDQRNYILSCGIVAIQDGHHAEFTYSRDKVNQSHCGYHELYAFTEAVLLVNAFNMKPSETAFFIDDQFIAEAGIYLHVENYLGSKREWVLQRLQHFVTYFYTEEKPGRPTADEIFHLLVDFMYNARIQHVKGHVIGPRGAIYNKRADYLAQRARVTAVDKEAIIMDYETWLSNGFFKYIDENTMERIHIPFVDVNPCGRPSAL